jgi:hypothetical protein
MVRLVVSQLEELDTFELLLANSTSHETSSVVATVTVLFVPLVVDLVSDDELPSSVNDSAVRRTVPVQDNPACSVKDRVPLTGAP